jgi:hypothetical protein
VFCGSDKTTEVGKLFTLYVSSAADKLKVVLVAVCPATTTKIAPVDAPIGTGTTTVVSFQLVGIAGVPLKLTVLVPWAAPKFAPEIVTRVPIGPEFGEKEPIEGGTVTVKLTPLLSTLFTVTATFPDVAPIGTGTTICVEFQTVGVAATPLNVTVLVPCTAPKLVPVIVTDVPTDPEVGDRLAIAGGKLKLTPLLAAPPTVSTTLPVVAPAGTATTICVIPQFVGVAAMPLKLTVLAP